MRWIENWALAAVGAVIIKISPERRSSQPPGFVRGRRQIDQAAPPGGGDIPLPMHQSWSNASLRSE